MKIGKEKQERIKENILSFLYHSSPKMFFTSELARETARDEEFIKTLLLEMEKHGLIIAVRKNNKGRSFKRRIRWRISNKAHTAYSKAI